MLTTKTGREALLDEALDCPPKTAFFRCIPYDAVACERGPSSAQTAKRRRATRRGGPGA